MHPAIHVTYRTARKIAIAIIGTTIVLLGVAMLVLPGPGILTIILGLMLLGVEFAFARRWLARLKATSRKAADRVRSRIRREEPRPGLPGQDKPLVEKDL
ncbi:MAG TPA: PGPGW domain-containing protein [Candidatus Krumholzibacteria bacterium]